MSEQHGLGKLVGSGGRGLLTILEYGDKLAPHPLAFPYFLVLRINNTEHLSCNKAWALYTYG